MKRLVLVLLLAAPPALADDDRVPPVTDPLVLKECGECHMAFQPAFLPARSWNAVMDGLSDHFGDDASLPADTVEAIRRVLVAGAGRERKRDRGEFTLAITKTRWFRHEHRFPDRVWADPKVTTPSNCPACHRDAERGWYEED